MKSENNGDNRNAENRTVSSAGGARKQAPRQKNAGSRTRQYRGGNKNRQDKPFRPTAKKAATGGAVKNSSRNTQRPVKNSGRPSGRKNSRRSSSKLKIIPLGGLEQIGMNITAFEYEDSIVVVDCGLSFPEDDMLGIDLVIPDVTYLKENISKVKGFVDYSRT